LARDPSEVQSEADAALLQLTLSRLALVAVLLIGAYMLGLALRVLARQRATLAETNAQLAKASQAKSQFLASVSHELRTPMNAILGFTDALLAGVDGPLNEEQKASLTWVQRGGQDLLALINEILDLSKIEAGKLVITPELFLPADLVESVCAQYRSMAAQKGLRLSWRDDGMPGEVHLDRQRTRQILVNLVGNALKFTSEGEVEIVADGGDHLRLTVRDTGQGIAADQLELIFEDFRQAAGTVGGTGLGLAISRRLARLMGGDLAVASEVGRGSTFTVTLPADMRAPAAAIAATPVRARQQSLLMAVDDDPSVAPLLEKMLGDRGYQVVGMTDPAMAVAEARRLHPNVITLDILMPERDGRDVFADLRADPATREIPIIALTVLDKGDVPSGADAHLTKPIRKDRLLRTLEQVVPVTIDAR
jgi:signal transduction histidine kinase/CheY-like chemotaxis protein